MTIELFDFSDPRAADAWRAIDDRVMGGISAAACGTTQQVTRCSKGTVSLERKTAASHRCGPAPANADKAGATACLIELRGDNKQFKLSLLTDDGFDSLNYQASFAPIGHRLADLQPAAGRHSAPASADARCRVHPSSTPHASARSA
jgi:NADH dehydrogenase [ubiquinone] 1 alpha subcomplex assembly factor 1